MPFVHNQAATAAIYVMTNTPKQRRAFICHSSMDKERFVHTFGTELRKKGVDAWVDEWELLPGDSLEQKIFQEGIPSAEAMVVVVSAHSAESKWVRDELRAGMLEQATTEMRIIPILLDDCAVPSELHDMLWTRASDFPDEERLAEHVVDAIHGRRNTPELAELSRVFTSNLFDVPGLEPADTETLRAICEIALEEQELLVSRGRLEQQLAASSISGQRLDDCLEILSEQYFVKPCRTLGSPIMVVSPRHSGLEAYAKAVVPNYAEICKAVKLAILNHELKRSEQLAAHVDGCTELLACHILDGLEKRGHVKLTRRIGNTKIVVSVSPSFRRSMR